MLHEIKPPAPDHIRNWMQRNLNHFRGRKLSDFMWIPGTHDSGMTHFSWSSKFATEANTLTQQYSIANQLRLGVRWFDLRPMWHRDKWILGHANDTKLPFIGWQGGTGPYLREVIEDLNIFTSSHAELIILRVTHITDAITGEDVRYRFPDLIQEIWGHVDHIYLGANGLAEGDLHNKTLEYFIGDGKSKVIITIAGDEEGPGLHQTDDLGKVPARLTDFNVTDGQSIVIALNWHQNIPGGKDIRYAASQLQDTEWPLMPYKLWKAMAPSGRCKRLEIDCCWNNAHITVCLASSHARIMAKNRRQYGDVVIVYGGKLIQDDIVRNRLLNAARSFSPFLVSNENLGGDTWVGHKKACAVFVIADNNIAWAKFGWEGDHLDFNNPHSSTPAFPPPPPLPDHLYTTSEEERDRVQKYGYKEEQFAGYVYPEVRPDTVPFYRLYKDGDHMYTSNVEERDKCVAFDYELEFQGTPACWLPATAQPGTTVLMRSYLTTAGSNQEHFYFTESREDGAPYKRDVDAGHIFTEPKEGTVKFYRLYRPYM